MKQYIGTKVVQAEPQKCYWTTDGNGKFFFHYGEEPANVVRVKDGYRMADLSGQDLGWLPAKQFEEDYREVEGMSFGEAIEAMKKGYRVARKGWNGKNMSVAYQKGYPDGIPCNKNTAEAWGMEEGELFKCRPYLQMRCADGTFQMWLASQSDILADDWYIVW